MYNEYRNNKIILYATMYRDWVIRRSKCCQRKIKSHNALTVFFQFRTERQECKEIENKSDGNIVFFYTLIYNALNLTNT